jgi:hypothetical protein
MNESRMKEVQSIVRESEKREREREREREGERNPSHFHMSHSFHGG